MNCHELETKAIAVSDQLLASKGYLSMLDVLMMMGKLTRENHDRWRFRQLAHLENVLPGSLNQFQFLLRTVRAHALDRLRLKAQPHGLYILGQGPPATAAIQQIWKFLPGGIVFDSLRKP
jgi:hypothetical protein